MDMSLEIETGSAAAAASSVVLPSADALLMDRPTLLLRVLSVEEAREQVSA